MTTPPVPPPPSGGSRFTSGFSTLKELVSYGLGAGVLLYGITGAAADRALIVVGAGLALLGAPLVGSYFDKKEE